MTASGREQLLAAARELEARDAAIARGIDEVDALQRETDALRSRAGAVDEFLERLPRLREETQATISDAETRLEERRTALEEAERRLREAERARKEEPLEAARRALARAQGAVGLAEKNLARAGEHLAQLEREAEDASLEARALHGEADHLAERLRRVPRISKQASDPPRDPAALVAWGGDARAALFVVRGSLDAERDAVIREANELAANLLGETVAATNVSLVRTRIEAALAP